MSRMTTGDLLASLTQSDAQLPEALAQDGFQRMDLGCYLENLVEDRGLHKIDVIRQSGLNETFAYQIFSGDRRPSRNKLLQLLFALRCNLTEADQALYRAGCNRLYCHDRRDAIIIFCLAHGYTLAETEHELQRLGEQGIDEAFQE